LSVWVVSGECGDYYCGCGLGHLVGVATTLEEAERLAIAGEAAEHHYASRGTVSRGYRSFFSLVIKEVRVNELLHQELRG